MKRHMLKFLLFGLSWREKAARFNSEGIDVLWMGYREGFQQGSHFVFFNVGLLSEADLGRECCKFTQTKYCEWVSV